MDRRSLLTAGIAMFGSTVAGCLGNGDIYGDSNPTENTDGTGDFDMTDSSADASDDNVDGGIGETRFEVLGSDVDYEISASVTFETDSVTVSGTIGGNNSCYTAKLEEASIENRHLLVNVESYEDRDEDEGCMEAEYGIDYVAVIVFDEDPPTEVTVNHNGEPVITEQSS